MKRLIYASNENDDEWELFPKTYKISGGASGDYFGDYNKELADYVSSGNVTRDTDSPATAVEAWFRIEMTHRGDAAIMCQKKDDAVRLLGWCDYNRDFIEDWHKKYKCPYKLDYILSQIDRQLEIACKYFHESEYGDQIEPFSYG